MVFYKFLVNPLILNGCLYAIALYYVAKLPEQKILQKNLEGQLDITEGQTKIEGRAFFSQKDQGQMALKKLLSLDSLLECKVI